MLYSLGLFKRARVFALAQNLKSSHHTTTPSLPIQFYSLSTPSQSLFSMRIRGRSLPFPPLLTSPSTPLSDPSTPTSISLLAPKRDFTTEQSGGSGAPVKDEQVSLHPNGDLLPTNSHAFQSFSPPYPTSLSPTQVLLKKEEAELEKGGGSVFESTANAPVSVAKRATNCHDNNVGNPDCTMMKRKKKEGKSVVAKEKKLVRNSSVLVEGSRCSRVNGRGWRCSQPTLVGYLLCEHHLGKGRIRNASNATTNRGQLGCTENKRSYLSENGSADEAVRKKRNIVPTFKARSIRSLLDGGNGQ